MFASLWSGKTRSDRMFRLSALIAIGAGCFSAQGAPERRATPTLDPLPQAEPLASQRVQSSSTVSSPTTLITGHLHSRTGQYHPDHLNLSLSISCMATEDCPVTFQRIGSEWIGIFDCELLCSTSFYPGFSTYPLLITPEATPLTCDTPHIEFMCEDATPTYEISFRAIDADTCESVLGAQLRIERIVSVEPSRENDFSSKAFFSEYSDSPKVSYQLFREGSNYRVVASAPGYQVSVGNEDSLVRPIDGTGKAIQELLLHRGWGTEFLVIDGPRGLPLKSLPTAAISIDGAAPIQVDWRGRLVVNRPIPPTRIDLYCQDYSWSTFDQVDKMRNIARMSDETTLWVQRVR